MKVKNIICTLLFSLALCLLPLSQSDAATTGKVTNASGEAVSGATVSCEIQLGGQWKDWNGELDEAGGVYGADYWGQQNPALTDGNGRFGWLMPAGTYRIKVTAEGYKDYTSDALIVGMGEGALAPDALLSVVLEAENEEPPTPPDPENIDIKGVVKNAKSGATIKGIAVTLEAENNGSWAKAAVANNPATSGDDGSFAFNLPAGTYRFTVSAEGYSSYTSDSFTVGDGAGAIDPAVAISVELSAKSSGSSSGSSGTGSKSSGGSSGSRANTGVVSDLNLSGNTENAANGENTETAPATTGSDVLSSYTDVDMNEWYVDAVRYAVSSGIMDGVGSGRFAPTDTLSRAMMVQILYNHEGRPTAEAQSFSDVSAGDWYSDAVSWAVSAGITNGVSARANAFGPDREITREQLALMLYRYTGSPAARGSISNFSDADEISGWAKDAMTWAVSNGIMNGYRSGKLIPKATATRAEAATMFMRYFELYNN